LPVTLGGFSMQSIAGIALPLFFTSTYQVNFQVPWEFAGLTQTGISVTANSITGAPQAIALATYAPGIFSTGSNGIGQGSIVDPSGQLINSNNPATRGTTIASIYCTGLGPVTNPPATGAPAGSNPLSTTTATPTVTVGGIQAQVLYSGLAPGLVGGYQVNVPVPATSPAGNAIPVIITMGGVVSNTVTIAVK
jgi:uncharacterized protein (TIGR03437 family)